MAGRPQQGSRTWENRLTYIEMQVDVTHAMPKALGHEQPLFLSAWIFIPNELAYLDGKAVVLAMLNGATYDKRYWHLEAPGQPPHSFAEHFRQTGAVVILLDHLGVGRSSRPTNGHLIDRHVAASAAQAALDDIFARLRAGTLHANLPPLPAFLKFGGGHSMGAMVLVTQQAEYETFDGLIVTGYTAIGVHLLQDGELVSGDLSPIDYGKPHYVTVPHSEVRESFFWPTTSAELIALDDSMTVEVPYVLIVQSSTAGIIAEEAARITVPVYICLGEIDVSPRPHDEPSFYRGSRHVTLHILPRSGHCQVYAETRAEMFNAIEGWIRCAAALT